MAKAEVTFMATDIALALNSAAFNRVLEGWLLEHDHLDLKDITTDELREMGEVLEQEIERRES